MSKTQDIQFRNAVMTGLRQTSISLLLAATLLSAPVEAQVAGAPAALMAYQGYLTDLSGTPLAAEETADYSVQFSLYTVAQGGQRIWAEEQTVAVSQGFFTVLLGEGTPLVEPAIPLPSAFAQISGDGAFLEMAVRFSPEQDHQPLLPRLRMAFAPYAVMGQLASELINDNGAAQITIDGIDAIVSNLTVSNSVTALGGVSGAAGTGLTGLNANAVDRGTFNSARMPSIPVTKITSGRFGEDRLPGLNASVFTSGTLSTDTIPSIPGEKITSGTFSLNQLQNFSAANFSGTLSVNVIPPIPNAKISSGAALPVPRGGTGRQWQQVGTLLRTDGANPLITSADLIYSTLSEIKGLRAAGGGWWQEDWPSGWGGGLQTYDVVGAGLRYSNFQVRSDERLKRAIEPLPHGNSLPVLMALRPVAFNWLDARLDEGRFVYGFIAQEVEAVNPELISRSDDEEGILAVRDDQFYSWMVSGLQEQQNLLRENQVMGLQFDERVAGLRDRILALDREVNRHD